MIHFGERFADAALCGDTSGQRTVFARNLTCPACIARRERHAEIVRYRCDHDLCISVLMAHAARRGNEWRSL